MLSNNASKQGSKGIELGSGQTFGVDIEGKGASDGDETLQI